MTVHYNSKCKCIWFRTYLPLLSERSKYSKRFYTVFIFDTKQRMQNYGREMAKILKRPKLESFFNYAGICWHWRPYAAKRKGGIEVGQVHLCIESIGAGVVSHEMTHAACYHLEVATKGKIRNFHEDNEMDELLAWTQGELVRQFWGGWFKAEGRGFIEKIVEKAA